MAIPVIVDNTDYEEVILQQLFADLWYTLQQIEYIQRSRQNQNPTRGKFWKNNNFIIPAKIREKI